MTALRREGERCAVGNPFFEGTSVRPVAAGRYEGEIAEMCGLRPLPQGDIVTAMALWDCGADGSGPRALVAYATQLFLFTFPA